MITVYMMYFAAAAASSASFFAAGCRGRPTTTMVSVLSRNESVDDAWHRDHDLEYVLINRHTDAADALRLALNRMAPLMTRQSVQAEMVTPTGIMIDMRGVVLINLLEDLLTTAIHAAPTSRLLLAATAHGDHICLAVTDDIPGADAHIRNASLRRLKTRVARLGGMLDVDVQPTEGTTMNLRLPATGH